MTGVPPPTLYHRWLGWHAPAMRRAITVLIAGLIVAVVLLPFITWELALVGGWNATALTFLLTTWQIIIRADSSRAPPAKTRQKAPRGCCWSGPAWLAFWGRAMPFTSRDRRAAHRGCC
jgi:hypothetical protein